VEIYRALCPRFIIAISTNEKMQFLVENWRKSGSMQLLLCELAKLNSTVTEFLISRQLISQIIDTILGNQSPLSGVLYDPSSRKRAPTSYVAAYRTKDGSIPVSVTRVTPDWTHFLSLLATLVQYCKNQELYMLSKSAMSEWDSQCVNSKTLYTTLLRQYRYVNHATSIITQLSYDNKVFTNLICEVLFEEFSLTSTEGLAHIFIVLESFLRISDSWTLFRCQSLFNCNENPMDLTNQFNILELLAGMKDNALKTKFLCVCIRSFTALVSQVGGSLKDTLSRPVSKVSVWAPWMLKVIYRYMNQCSTSNSAVMDAIAATSSSTANGSSGSGPYLYVYGEAESDSEIAWTVRAEKTFVELNSCIVSLGANPDLLIPDDAFVQNGSGVASDSTKNDENLARYFQNAENLGHEMDID